MTSAAWALQQAIYDALTSNATLMTLIGDPPRVYDGAPAKPVFPFVLFGDARQTPLAGAEGLIAHDLRLAVHSRYDGAREAKAIVAAIVAALNDAPLTLPGFHLVSLGATAVDVFHRADVDAHQGAVRFRAVTEAI